MFNPLVAEDPAAFAISKIDARLDALKLQFRIDHPLVSSNRFVATCYFFAIAIDFILSPKKRL